MMGIENKEYIKEALDIVGLKINEIKNKKVKNYSLGMKQRLGIARAILHKPELLILDEPTNGLDPLGIKDIRQTLIDLRNKKGITILISTHLLSEVEHLATEIGVIHKGRLLEIDYKQLQKRNRKYLKVKVSDDKKACFLLENKLNIRDFDVSEKNEVRIYGNLDRGSEIAKIFISNHIELHEMHLSTDNLEDYFVKLTGEIQMVNVVYCEFLKVKEILFLFSISSINLFLSTNAMLRMAWTRSFRDLEQVFISG